mgnify:CR=1 FL=1
MKRLIFAFDVVSPFVYLAFERLPQVLEGCSYEVEYRPLLFAGLLKAHAHKGPAEIEPKRQWTFRHVHWLAHGFLDEWDYWAGTFGLVLMAVIETVLFMWIFKPEHAWRSIHQGADIKLPLVFKFIMTYVTPLYLMVILFWWGKNDALPILLNEKSAGGGAFLEADRPFILASRGVIVLFVIASAVLIRMAWKRNKYDDYKGFEEIPTNREVQGVA